MSEHVEHNPGPWEQQAVELGFEIDAFDDGDCGWISETDEEWDFPTRESAAAAAVNKAKGGGR